jgi:hypothetical protein
VDILNNSSYWPVFVIMVIVVSSSIWVLSDARKNSIAINDKPYGINNGGLAWTVSCLFLWIYFFPLYLFRRTKILRIKAGGASGHAETFVGLGLVVVALIAMVLIFAGSSKSPGVSTLNTILASPPSSPPGSDLIDFVKHNTLSRDKAATIGNVFDNYAFFKTVSWDIREDAQKRRFVTCVGVYNLSKIADATLTPTEAVQLLRTGKFLQSDRAFGDAEPLTEAEISAAKTVASQAKEIFINEAYCEYVAQFVISADETSFALGWHGLKMRRLKDAESREDTGDNEISAIYQNQESPAIVGELRNEAIVKIVGGKN